MKRKTYSIQELSKVYENGKKQGRQELIEEIIESLKIRDLIESAIKEAL